MLIWLIRWDFNLKISLSLFPRDNTWDVAGLYRLSFVKTHRKSGRSALFFFARGEKETDLRDFYL